MHAVWRGDSVVISDITWNAPFWLHWIAALRLRHSCGLPFELSLLDHLKTCALKKNSNSWQHTRQSILWLWSQDRGGFSECDGVRVVCKVKNLYTLHSQSTHSYFVCATERDIMNACLEILNESVCRLHHSSYLAPHVALPWSRLVRDINTSHFIQSSLFQTYSGFQPRWV